MSLVYVSESLNPTGNPRSQWTMAISHANEGDIIASVGYVHTSAVSLTDFNLTGYGNGVTGTYLEGGTYDTGSFILGIRFYRFPAQAGSSATLFTTLASSVSWGSYTFVRVLGNYLSTLTTFKGNSTTGSIYCPLFYNSVPLNGAQYGAAVDALGVSGSFTTNYNLTTLSNFTMTESGKVGWGWKVPMDGTAMHLGDATPIYAVALGMEGSMAITKFFGTKPF